MADLNDYFYTDGVEDVLAVYVNRLLAAALRSEYKNVETLAADKELTDADTPIQNLDGDGSDWDILMPAADTDENHPFFIVNGGATGTLTTKSNDGLTVIRTLAPGEAVLVLPDGNGGYLPSTDTAAYLLKSGLTAWDEQGSDPSTPASGKWKLYFKSGGLYIIDDAGTVIGPIDVRNYLEKTGLTAWDEQGSDPSTPASGKWKLYFKSGGLYIIDDAGTVIGPLAPGTSDMLSTLVNSEVSITGADTANWGKQHVVSGSSNYTVAIAACSGNAGKFLSLRITNTGITTVDPNSSETIDGVSTRKFHQDSFVILYTDGSNVFTVFQKSAMRGTLIPAANFNTNGAKAISILTSNIINGVWYNASNANGDWLECEVFLQAGSYTCEILGNTAPTAAKLDWTLDGVSQTAGQDWYAAGQAYNVSKTFTLTVPYTGRHVLRGTVNGRNASNTTGYYWLVSYINIYPAAY